MYNRYVPNDTGTYHRVPEPEIAQETPPVPPPPPPPNQAPPPPPPPTGGGEKKPFVGDGVQQFLRSMLDRFHLQDIDTGDLMLLALLFFLFKEDADEEVLFALGLLFIL